MILPGRPVQLCEVATRWMSRARQPSGTIFVRQPRRVVCQQRRGARTLAGRMSRQAPVQLSRCRSRRHVETAIERISDRHCWRNYATLNERATLVSVEYQGTADRLECREPGLPGDLENRYHRHLFGSHAKQMPGTVFSRNQSDLSIFGGKLEN